MIVVNGHPCHSCKHHRESEIINIITIYWLSPWSSGWWWAAFDKWVLGDSDSSYFHRTSRLGRPNLPSPHRHHHHQHRHLFILFHPLHFCPHRHYHHQDRHLFILFHPLHFCTRPHIIGRSLTNPLTVAWPNVSWWRLYSHALIIDHCNEHNVNDCWHVIE